MTKKIDKEIEATEGAKDESPARKYFYAAGGRKEAKATVCLYGDGKGEIKVNGQSFLAYFPFSDWQKIVLAPLELLGVSDKVDVSVKVFGGGKMGQAEAARHGIALALDKYNPEYHKTLKGAGLFTRDRRAKERKKPGLKRARRAPQWAKR